jgi:hypothetical protein
MDDQRFNCHNDSKRPKKLSGKADGGRELAGEKDVDLTAMPD